MSQHTWALLCDTNHISQGLTTSDCQIIEHKKKKNPVPRSAQHFTFPESAFSKAPESTDGKAAHSKQIPAQMVQGKKENRAWFVSELMPRIKPTPCLEQQEDVCCVPLCPEQGKGEVQLEFLAGKVSG